MSQPRTKCNRVRQSRRRRGAFTVEFALCSALFFMILMAGFEFTRFMYARHSVDQAAYEAARVGIIPGRSVADVTTKANQILSATGIRNATITITPSVINTSTATVNVKIQCLYADSSWLRPVFLLNSLLSADITLDHENTAYLSNSTSDVGDNDNEPTDT
jgi:Flp pilus assembly protein TadG